MKTFLIGYIISINLLGLALMGLDKWKAKKGRWRIPEKILFLSALLGGSIGSLVGIYLFRHKTRHLRFTIGIPVILVLQLLFIVYFFMHQHESAQSPSAAVANELSLIQNLDETTIHSFISYESMMNTPSASSDIGSETTEAVELFFKNFQYHIHSEDITDDTAAVSVEIINIDTKALAKDLCKALTVRNINLNSNSQPPETLNDYFTLLRDTLKNNAYGLTATTAYFHLKKTNQIWTIQSDETLQDELVSGFISWMNDPNLLSPEDIITIYLDEFSSLTAQEWANYLKADDIFSTGSETYSASVDQAYMEKISEFFSYRIDSCTSDEDTAQAQLTITSVDMPYVLDCYKDKLLKYAHSTESITSDDTGLSNAAAQYLLEALQEDARPADYTVTAALNNDGRTGQLEIAEELINAFLGDIAGGLEAFNAS